MKFALNEAQNAVVTLTSDNRIKLSTGVTLNETQEFTESDHLTRAYTALSWHCPKSAGRGKRARGQGTRGVVAVGSAKGEVTLWDLSLGQVRHRLHREDAGASAAVRAVAFSPDGASLFVASEDRLIVQWSTLTGAVAKTFKTGRVGADQLAVSPDGSCIAAAGSSLRLFDITSGKRIGKAPSQAERVTDAAFSADGAFLCVAAADRFVAVWSVAALKAGKAKAPVAVLPAPSIPSAIAVAPASGPDTLNVVAALEDGRAAAWTVAVSAGGRGKQVSVQPTGTTAPTEDGSAVRCVGVAAGTKKPRATLVRERGLQVALATVALEGVVALEDVAAVEGGRAERAAEDSRARSGVQSTSAPAGQVHVPSGADAGGLLGGAATALSAAMAAAQAQPADAAEAEAEAGAAKRARAGGVADESVALETRLRALDKEVKALNDVPGDRAPGTAPNAAADWKQLGVEGAASSMHTVLVQALRTRDTELLEQVLRVTDKRVRGETVKRLPPAHVVPFLRMVVAKFEQRPARAATLVPWVSALLFKHLPYLQSVPDIVQHLAPLYQAIDTRCHRYLRVQRLRGRLELLLEHSAASREAVQRFGGVEDGEGVAYVESDPDAEDDEGDEDDDDAEEESDSEEGESEESDSDDE